MRYEEEVISRAEALASTLVDRWWSDETAEQFALSVSQKQMQIAVIRNLLAIPRYAIDAYEEAESAGE